MLSNLSLQKSFPNTWDRLSIESVSAIVFDQFLIRTISNRHYSTLLNLRQSVSSFHVCQDSRSHREWPNSELKFRWYRRDLRENERVLIIMRKGIRRLTSFNSVLEQFYCRLDVSFCTVILKKILKKKRG